jgi:hypothetical protein
MLVRRVGKLRGATATCTDERVRLTGEVIQVTFGTQQSFQLCSAVDGC